VQYIQLAIHHGIDKKEDGNTSRTNKRFPTPMKTCSLNIKELFHEIESIQKYNK
jgi:hypothetical protein